jgi:inhibitor of cysteine peptidase
MKKYLSLSLIGSLVFLSACSLTNQASNPQDTPGNTDTELTYPTIENKPDDEFLRAQAMVTEISLNQTDETLEITAKGNLPDSCTELDEVLKSFTNETFIVNITTKRPKDQICAQVITEFEEIVVLEIEAVPSGEYTVDVNGLSKTFSK